MGLETAAYRLLAAAGLGLVIGFERELHGRSAGLRTQVVVAVCACLLMILSLELETLFRGLSINPAIRLDPSRVASYAVAGMGFLGAGAIIHGKGSVQGLTTAACLWVSNAVGLAVGAGMIVQGVGAVMLVMGALILLQPMERLLPRDVYMRVYLNFDSCADRTFEIKSLLEEHTVKVIYAGLHCSIKDEVSSYELAIRIKSTHNWEDVLNNLRKLEGLTGIRLAEGHVP